MSLPSIENYLQEFEQWAQKHPGPCPHSVTLEFGRHAGHAVFGSVVHGNETGSLPAVLATLHKLHNKTLAFGGKVTFFLGNVEACRRNVRFVEADLNRVFLDSAPPSAEALRAQELMPLLRSATVFFDFHQTIQPAEEPFYIFGFHEKSYLWARAVQGARVMVTRKQGTAFAANQICCDEYARNFNVPAVTLELGQKGLNPEAAALAETAMARVLNCLDATTPLAELAEQQPDFRFFEIVHREPFVDPRSGLKPGLRNFTQVKAGEKLGITSEFPFVAHAESRVLFPKYPERNAQGCAEGELPSEIFQLAVELHTHPRRLWPPPI